MSKNDKVEALSELFDLINVYYEERDLPNAENDFFKKVEKCCSVLHVDFDEVKEKFGLNGAL